MLGTWPAACLCPCARDFLDEVKVADISYFVPGHWQIVERQVSVQKLFFSRYFMTLKTSTENLSRQSLSNINRHCPWRKSTKLPPPWPQWPSRARLFPPQSHPEATPSGCMPKLCHGQGFNQERPGQWCQSLMHCKENVLSLVTSRIKSPYFLLPMVHSSFRFVMVSSQLLWETSFWSCTMPSMTWWG